MNSFHVIYFATGLLALGGFIDGSIGLILKFPKHWRWEHLWLVYALVAFVVIPWIVCLLTVSNLASVLRSAASSDIILVALFGLCWGCGAVLYGLALDAAGMSLTYAIVMGLTTAIGTLAPFLIFHPAKIMTDSGMWIITAVMLVVAGVTLCAIAGHYRSRAIVNTGAMSDDHSGRRPMLGVVLAIFSGILSPMINLAFAYGASLATLATATGTNPYLASNVIWAIALSMGGIVNVAYCCKVIHQNRSWQTFAVPSFDWLLGLLMGLLGPASLILYGIGTAQMGRLGPVVGWPIMSSMGILGANVWGALSGEWRNVGRFPIALMCLAGLLLIVSMFVIGQVDVGQ